MRKIFGYDDVQIFALMERLYQAYQNISRQDIQQSASWELGGSEFGVLATLGDTEGMRMRELAERSQNKKSNLTRVVKELERRGLVVRKRNPNSEREVLVRLTPEGEKTLLQTYPQKHTMLRQFFDERLNEEEQAQLLQLLAKLS